MRLKKVLDTQDIGISEDILRVSSIFLLMQMLVRESISVCNMEVVGNVSDTRTPVSFKSASAVFLWIQSQKRCYLLVFSRNSNAISFKET